MFLSCAVTVLQLSPFPPSFFFYSFMQCISTALIPFPHLCPDLTLLPYTPNFECFQPIESSLSYAYTLEYVGH